MNGTNYVIRYYGELKPGFTIDQVHSAFGQVFRADASVIDAIFSHRRVVLARNLTGVQADILVGRLDDIGMVVKKEPEQAAAPAPPSPEKPIEKLVEKTMEKAATPEAMPSAETPRPGWDLPQVAPSQARETARFEPETQPCPEPPPAEEAPSPYGSFSSFPEIINGTTRLTIPPEPSNRENRA